MANKRMKNFRVILSKWEINFLNKISYSNAQLEILKIIVLLHFDMNLKN